MSTMNGNPHFDSSFASMARIEGTRTTFQEAENVQGGAQVTATWALAYEQRTANLLHALEISYRAQGTGWQINPADIAARLGLNEGATE